MAEFATIHKKTAAHRNLHDISGTPQLELESKIVSRGWIEPNYSRRTDPVNKLKWFATTAKTWEERKKRSLFPAPLSPPLTYGTSSVISCPDPFLAPEPFPCSYLEC